MELTAEWITGFVDGEGCFHIGISKHNEMSMGFQILPEFTVVQHQRDIQLLHAIKKYFDCGVVRANHGDRMAYRVRKLEHLEKIIIPFFQKYPLRSQKKFDFEIFRDVVKMIRERGHLSEEGLQKIRILSKRMNRGKLRESPALLETLEV